MTSIEEDEELIYYLEQIDNKFCNIKNVLRKIKTKVQKISETNKNINFNCKHWINFFKLDVESGCKNEYNANENMENSVNVAEGSTLLENVKITSTEVENEHNSKNNLNEDENNFKVEDLTMTTENATKCFLDESNSFAVFDIADVPETFASDPALTQIMDHVKKHKQIDIDKIKNEFLDISPKKVEIIVNFLVGRNYIMKKNNKLLYKQ